MRERARQAEEAQLLTRLSPWRLDESRPLPIKGALWPSESASASAASLDCAPAGAGERSVEQQRARARAQCAGARRDQVMSRARTQRRCGRACACYSSKQHLSSTYRAHRRQPTGTGSNAHARGAGGRSAPSCSSLALELRNVSRLSVKEPGVAGLPCFRLRVRGTQDRGLVLRSGADPAGDRAGPELGRANQRVGRCSSRRCRWASWCWRLRAP